MGKGSGGWSGLEWGRTMGKESEVGTEMGKGSGGETETRCGAEG